MLYPNSDWKLWKCPICDIYTPAYIRICTGNDWNTHSMYKAQESDNVMKEYS